MASGVQLATAYISLNVRTDGIKKQVESALSGVGGQGRAIGTSIGSNITSGIRSHIGDGRMATLLFAPMELAGVRWAAKAGVAIGSVLKKAIIGAASLTGIGSIFAVGGVLTAGLERLKTLQASTVQLRLKLSPEEIKKVQQDIADVVTGTPIALDQAMQAVPKAISAGLRGDAVKQYVKDLADLTAATGGQGGGYQQMFDRLAIIMDQVRSKGKLAGEELLQLVDAGVDVRGLLKEGMGWDDKTLNNKLKSNKVGFAELQKSIEKVYGTVQAKNGKTGLAQQIGETFEGATGALKTSAARLGANLIAAIVGKKANEDPLKDYAIGITKITDALNGMGAWVDRNREGIYGVSMGVKSVFEWFGKVSDKSEDIGTKIGQAFIRGKTAIQGFIDKIREIWTSLKTWVLDKFDAVFGPNSTIGKLLTTLGFGTATANAAAPGAAPFNPGPLAPGAVPPGTAVVPGTIGPGSGGVIGGPVNPGLTPPGRAGLPPGTRLDGSDQKIAGVPSAPNARPGSYPGDSAILGRVQAGRYVSQPGVGDLTQGLGDCTSAIEDLVAIIEGRPTAGRTMATGNAETWLTNNGFVPTDKPVPGSFQVGYFNDPTAPGGGHMQATMPDGTKINWGSDAMAANKGVGDSGAWDDPRFNKHYYKQYGSGGSISGSGTGTSDSIPAMVSNGEHVLTASDVKKMGGQRGVYAFRSALQSGLIPGYENGGAVDPAQLQDLQNQLADAQKASEIAQAQFNEVMGNSDASDAQRLNAQINMEQAMRNAQQLASDYPIIASGGTPPDRSVENSILSYTDQLKQAQQSLKDLPEDASYSQRLQAEAAVAQAQRGRDQSIAAYDQKNNPGSYLDQFTRSLGFVPTAAGNTGVAGTSALSSVIGMGNDVVGGLIDTGASIAQTAATAAITAGAAAGGGGGAAAAPAASAAAAFGIQTGAKIAKRVSSYGFQLASIGADSLIAQAFPFGAPRLLGYDYTNFAPQLGFQQAMTTTLEKMGSDAINKHFGNKGFQVPAQPQSPEAPMADPQGPAAAAGPAPFDAGQGLIQQGDPGFYDPFQTPVDPFNPNGAGGGGGGGSWAKGGAIRIYDSGGILRPGDLALNASTKPEKILTQKQWDSLGNLQPANSQGPLVKIDTIYGMSPDDVANKIEAKQKLAMMRYAGRP